VPKDVRKLGGGKGKERVGAAAWNSESGANCILLYEDRHDSPMPRRIEGHCEQVVKREQGGSKKVAAEHKRMHRAVF